MPRIPLPVHARYGIAGAAPLVMSHVSQRRARDRYGDQARIVAVLGCA
jgi:hypothetical protein